MLWGTMWIFGVFPPLVLDAPALLRCCGWSTVGAVKRWQACMAGGSLPAPQTASAAVAVLGSGLRVGHTGFHIYPDQVPHTAPGKCLPAGGGLMLRTRALPGQHCASNRHMPASVCPFDHHPAYLPVLHRQPSLSHSAPPVRPSQPPATTDHPDNLQAKHHAPSTLNPKP